MNQISKEEQEKRKKAIFDAMGKRGQQSILKKGYDEWDPFEEPKDPIDMRDAATRKTSQALIREFLQETSMDDYNNEYGRAVYDFCFGLINNDEKFKAMFKFACWYKEKLDNEEQSK